MTTSKLAPEVEKILSKLRKDKMRLNEDNIRCLVEKQQKYDEDKKRKEIRKILEEYDYAISDVKEKVEILFGLTDKMIKDKDLLWEEQKGER